MRFPNQASTCVASLRKLARFLPATLAATTLVAAVACCNHWELTDPSGLLLSSAIFGGLIPVSLALSRPPQDNAENLILTSSGTGIVIGGLIGAYEAIVQAYNFDQSGTGDLFFLVLSLLGHAFIGACVAGLLALHVAIPLQIVLLILRERRSCQD